MANCTNHQLNHSDHHGYRNSQKSFYPFLIPSSGMSQKWPKLFLGNYSNPWGWLRGKRIVLPYLILVSFILCSCETATFFGESSNEYLPAQVEAYLAEHQEGPAPHLFQTTRVYDRNGVLIAELFHEGRREWVPYNQISPYLIDATVATEDATFFTNQGVDPVRVAGAAIQNTKAGEIVSGASTITMQLARNLFLTPKERYENTFRRKRLEATLASELTQRHSKEELLEMYLNLVNYGQLAYGPEAAAQVYFGKSAVDLNMAEATLLAGIPQQPARLNPYFDYAAAKQRQRVVLDLMVRQRKITERVADAVYAQPILLVGDPGLKPNLAPHFVQMLEVQLDKKFGRYFTRRSGLEITTTLDLHMQEIAQNSVAKQVAALKGKYNIGNGALVAMRPKTGEVLAAVGSADFYNDAIDGQVNVAISPRQPGSSIKPILFAIAMDDQLLSPATIIWDMPVTYETGGGAPYRPQNYDEQFHGLVTVRSALGNSYNVPAVKVLDSLGIERMLEGSQQMGIHSLSGPSDEYGLPLSLGDSEVTLLEMTTAYHTLASEGLYFEPRTVLKATDRRGEPSPIVEAFESNKQAVSAATAFMMTDILSDNEARRPMFGSNSPLNLNVPAAAKTGTTSAWRDNWAIGYTRYLVAGVWAGNSNGRPTRRSTGVTGAAPIWREFMDAVHASPEMLALLNAPSDSKSTDWTFVKPSDVEKITDCPLRLACRAGGEYFSHDWLESTGKAGPMADNFVQVPSAPVHADRYGNPWLSVYCTREGEKVRTLLNLEGSLKLPGATQAINSTRASQRSGLFKRLSYLQNGETQLVFYPNSEIERFKALGWSRYRGVPANIGPCASLQYYKVQRGDYWIRLAKQFGLTTRELQAANPHVIRQNGVLRPGDRLLVPAGKLVQVTVHESKKYTVQPGDSWAKISKDYGVSLGLLQAANPKIVRPGFLLQPEDEMLIPNVPDL